MHEFEGWQLLLRGIISIVVNNRNMSDIAVGPNKGHSVTKREQKPRPSQTKGVSSVFCFENSRSGFFPKKIRKKSGNVLEMCRKVSGMFPEIFRKPFRIKSEETF